MAEYIELETVLKTLSNILGEANDMEDTPGDYVDGWIDGVACAMDEMQEIAITDVRPERHGYWREENNSNAWWYICSKCGRSPLINTKHELTPFCPYCGTKMSKTREE